jgi:acetyl esterase/lipase
MAKFDEAKAHVYMSKVSQSMEPYHTTVGIYKPMGHETCDLPAMIYFHGGGYMAGSIETEDPHCRIFASRTPCVVFNVEYPLASDGNNLDTIIDAGVNAVTWVR